MGSKRRHGRRYFSLLGAQFVGDGLLEELWRPGAVDLTPLMKKVGVWFTLSCWPMAISPLHEFEGGAFRVHVGHAADVLRDLAMLSVLIDCWFE